MICDRVYAVTLAVVATLAGCGTPDYTEPDLSVMHDFAPPGPSSCNLEYPACTTQRCGLPCDSTVDHRCSEHICFEPYHCNCINNLWDCVSGAQTCNPTPANCGQLIDCTNDATSQAAYDGCINGSGPAAKALFTALINCISNWCGTVDGGAPTEPSDGGTGACGGFDTCVSCVQTGMGATQSNGMCTATQGGPTLNDPRCGQCVDQLIACANDQ